MLIRIDRLLVYFALILGSLLVNLLADVFLSGWLIWVVFLFTAVWFKKRWFEVHWAFWLGLWFSFFQAARLGSYSFIFLSLILLVDYLNRNFRGKGNGGF
jgi:hypothetical protein